VWSDAPYVRVGALSLEEGERHTARTPRVSGPGGRGPHGNPGQLTEAGAKLRSHPKWGYGALNLYCEGVAERRSRSACLSTKRLFLDTVTWAAYSAPKE
jgi:hypothetical protein